MNKTTLIIARHGNTFTADETPRRVGLKTDLPLVESGRAQAVKIGEYLAAHNLRPDAVYSSTLKRTIETAEIALKTAGFREPVYPLTIFDEIDYGVDENKVEAEVIARLGEEALKNWDENAVPPQGWNVNPDDIIENWIKFGAHITAQKTDCHSEAAKAAEESFGVDLRSFAHAQDDKGEETVMVVTSNGIARFAPYLTGDFESFRAEHKIKISTGAICILEHHDHRWTVKQWNVKP